MENGKIKLSFYWLSSNIILTLSAGCLCGTKGNCILAPFMRMQRGEWSKGSFSSIQHLGTCIMQCPRWGFPAQGIGDQVGWVPQAQCGKSLCNSEMHLLERLCNPIPGGHQMSLVQDHWQPRFIPTWTKLQVPLFWVLRPDDHQRSLPTQIAVKLLLSFTLSVNQNLWPFNYCNIKGKKSSHCGLGSFPSYFSPFFPTPTLPSLSLYKVLKTQWQLISY